jgi:hypothetical protein
MTNPLPVSISSSQTAIFKKHSYLGNQDLLEKWMISGLKQEMYQISLERLILPDSGKAIKGF